MKEYLRISLILSTFGFLKETRPSESFLTNFITDFKNVTLEQINQDIFPIGTYSHLTQLVIIFLITDFLRYKPLMIVLASCGVAIWSIFLAFDSVQSLQIVEIIYGTYCATEVAYFAYIYAKTDKENYQVVTSHTRAAMFVGRFVAAVSSQLLVYYDIMDYRQLNYLTLITQILALIWAFFIPPVKTSMYFNRDMSDGKVAETFTHNKITNAFVLIWIHFKTSYANKTVVMWSIFYAVALCFYVQINAYIQVLWISIDDSQENVYNGIVDATLTLISFAVSLLAGKIHLSFLYKKNRVLIVLVAMSTLQGLFVVLAARSQTLLPCYIFYVLYGSSYAFCNIICASEIARNLSDDAFALVFGFNSLIALSVQTIVTLTVVSNGFMLQPSQQFQVYGFSYIALGTSYLLALIFDILK